MDSIIDTVLLMGTSAKIFLMNIQMSQYLVKRFF